MNEILKKIGFKSQSPILVLNAPEEYNEIITGIDAEIHNEINGRYEFIQVFVKSMAEAVDLAEGVVRALEGDGYLWLCYPKGTSKKYKADINRTKAMNLFAPFDFEPVTQVSISDDWSALRYRNVNNIKSMKRKTAGTEKGKERIQENKDK